MKNLSYYIKDGLTDIGYNFISEKEDIQKYIKDPQTDHYHSIYLYTQEQVKEALTEIEVKNTAGKIYKRFRGVGRITDTAGVKYQTMENVVTNTLIWDLDSENVDESRKDAVLLVDRLKKYGISEQNIRVAFSGGKGFSIVVKIKEYLSPNELKTICTALGGDLSTFDTKVYNPSRIFRVPLTKHHSGLFKTPIPIETLRDYSAEIIKESAKDRIDPKDLEGIYGVSDLPADLKTIKVATKELTVNKSNDVNLVAEISELDWSKRLKFLTPAKFILHNGLGYGTGQRHEVYMILASSYKGAGFSQGDAYRLLKSVDEKHCEINNRDGFDHDEMWINIISTVFSDSWQGGTYPPEHPILAAVEDAIPEHLQRKDKAGLIKGNVIFDQFKKFALEIEKNTIKSGIKAFDSKIKLLTGTTVGLLGVPGSAKTTFAMNLLTNCSQTGEDGTFYSLDMNASLIALKQVQKVTGFDNDKIMKMIKEDYDRFEKIMAEALKQWENVEYSFKFGLTPADIRQDIVDRQERTGKKVRVIVVDYLENVQSGSSDPSIGSGMVAQQLANIAAEENVLIVILMQTQKSVNPGEAITSMRKIKGASVIEQSVSVALGIHREGQPLAYKDYDNFLTVNILKNRFGPLDSVTMFFDGAKSLVRDMDKDERMKYGALLQLKSDDRAEDDDERNGWGS